MNIGAKRGVIYFVLFFLLLIVLTFPHAYDPVLVNPHGDDDDFFYMPYKLAKGKFFDEKEQWIHIHKPMMFPLMFLWHKLGLTPYWYILPYIFYIGSAVALFILLRRLVSNRIILYGSVAIFTFNSVWWYFANHLLPEVFVVFFILLSLYFLDRSVDAKGSFNQKYWIITALLCTAAFLFRLELFPFAAVPLFYYAYIFHFKSSRSSIFARFKNAVSDKNIYIFIAVVIVFSALFFMFFLFLIKGEVSLFGWPAEIIRLIQKDVAFMTDFVSANFGYSNGAPLFPLTETILSFTILPFIFSLAGIFLILRKKAERYYPALFALIILLAELMIITASNSTEQRFFTRFFPFLILFLAYSLDQIPYLKLSALKKVNIQNIGAIFLIILLVYSSYDLVHRGFGKGHIIKGQMFATFTAPNSAKENFEWDLLYAIEEGGFLFLRDALISYDLEGYDIVYSNIHNFPHLIQALYGKKVYPFNKSIAPVPNSVFILMFPEPQDIDPDYLLHKKYSFYNETHEVYIYYLKVD